MNIRALTVVVVFLFLVTPAVVTAQTADTGGSGLDRFSLQIAGGPLLKSGGGHTLSAGLGFSPFSRVDFLVNVERDHVPFRRQTFSGSSGVTRGGTLTAVSGELRLSLMPPHRVSPYAFAGMGGGMSRPTVNNEFPTPVKNDLRVVYLGGGLRVPISGGLTVFGDARVMLALEGDDGLMGVWPVRAGLSWRF
jgi:hypothetical protein